MEQEIMEAEILDCAGLAAAGTEMLPSVTGAGQGTELISQTASGQEMMSIGNQTIATGNQLQEEVHTMFPTSGSVTEEVDKQVQTVTNTVKPSAASASKTPSPDAFFENSNYQNVLARNASGKLNAGISPAVTPSDAEKLAQTPTAIVASKAGVSQGDIYDKLGITGEMLDDGRMNYTPWMRGEAGSEEVQELVTQGGANSYVRPAPTHFANAEELQKYLGKGGMITAEKPLAINISPSAIELMGIEMGNIPLAMASTVFPQGIRNTFMYSNDFLHELGLDVAHEEKFYTDAEGSLYAAGFFNKEGGHPTHAYGIDVEKYGDLKTFQTEFDSIAQYKFSGNAYQNAAITTDILHPQGFIDPTTYSFGSHNCQHYINAVDYDISLSGSTNMCLWIRNTF